MYLFINNFLKKDSSSGILLMMATVLAMICANTGLQTLYAHFLETPVEIRIGDFFQIAKPLLLWINDGLMAVFFFLIGLEVKREILIGQLSSRSKIILPGIAAFGGMLIPAIIYYYFNADNEAALNGWAIPTATDIAFALGVLALIGPRVPTSLKIFLLALAIMDDLGAIVIIALFYSSNLSASMIIFAVFCLIVLTTLNRLNIQRTDPYMWVGVFLWIFVLKSGVHATLAGVALALSIPLRNPDNPQNSMLQRLMHRLHPTVSFLILPLFAFANAGVPLAGIGLDNFLEPVALGIVAGLFVGKIVGVYGFSMLAIKTGLATLPAHATTRHLLGVSALCGIGFTMSLFIGGLAFEHVGEYGHDYMLSHRIGILSGSILSGICGWAIFMFDSRKNIETNTGTNSINISSS
ncbi:MAG: Na+/H+ antiporter NhaA [Desulfuromonas sp.]|nr:MAG: Na+/H+ antiporter NhaA [Desulfuromonas sp.]